MTSGDNSLDKYRDHLGAYAGARQLAQPNRDLLLDPRAQGADPQ